MNARIMIKIKSERVDSSGGGVVIVNLVHIILVGKQSAPPAIWHQGYSFFMVEGGMVSG